MKEAHSARSGVMLDVFDQGVLLLGESGSGKSDVALAQVDRGHSVGELKKLDVF